VSVIVPRMHAETGHFEVASGWHGTATVAASGAQSLPPLPASRTSVAGSTAALILIVVLVWLVVSMGLVIWLLNRRRALDREIEEARKQRKAEREQGAPVDAWTEAGRRATASEAASVAGAAGDMGVRGVAGEPGAAGVLARDPNDPRPLAIVTGGARRVGRATCLALARAGFDVLVTYRHSASEAATLIEEIRALGGEGTSEQVDTSDEHAVEAFALSLVEQNRVVDALVLNASSYEPTPLDQLDAATMLRDFRVNALAGVLMTAKLAPCLRGSKREGGGAVVVMCDIHAMGRPRLDFASYNITKAAACESVYTLARELAPQVRVNGVAPGAVAWPEHGHESEQIAQQRYLKRVPLGRVGSPEDAANAVRWLIVEATYVTGQIVRVDGGRWVT